MDFSDFKTSELKILLYILNNGSNHGYQIKKNMKKYSDKTVYQGLNKLAEQALLRPSTEIAEDSGKPVKKYTLTIPGFCIAFVYMYQFMQEEYDQKYGEEKRSGDEEKRIMAEIDNAYNRMYDQCFNHWGSLLPYLSQKWDLFKQCGRDYMFADYFYKSIRDHAILTFKEIPFWRERLIYEESILFDFLYHVLDHFVPPTFGVTEYARLNKIFHVDPEFKAKVLECLNVLVLDYRANALLFESRKTSFEMLPLPQYLTSEKEREGIDEDRIRVLREQEEEIREKAFQLRHEAIDILKKWQIHYDLRYQNLKSLHAWSRLEDEPALR